METIIKYLDKIGTNLLMKAAIGTGKTLSLLVSCLSWLDQYINYYHCSMFVYELFNIGFRM